MYQATKQNRTSNRLGIAALEFTLLFPVMVLMIATFFWIVSVVVTRVSTGIEAREATLRTRFPGGQGARSPLATQSETVEIRFSAESKRILGGNRRGGSEEVLSSGSVSRTAPPILRIFEGMGGTADIEGFVLTNPWDFETIEFPEHPQLSLSDRILAFGFPTDQLAAFASLTPKGGTNHDGNYGREQRRVKQAQSLTSSELDKLYDKLRQLEGVDPADEHAISEVRRHIGNLEQALEQLGKAFET